MSTTQWSTYQQAIFEAVKTGTSNLAINAVAGSGKSGVSSTPETSSIRGTSVAQCRRKCSGPSGMPIRLSSG